MIRMRLYHDTDLNDPGAAQRRVEHVARRRAREDRPADVWYRQSFAVDLTGNEFRVPARTQCQIRSRKD